MAERRGEGRTRWIGALAFSFACVSAPQRGAVAPPKDAGVVDATAAATRVPIARAGPAKRRLATWVWREEAVLDRTRRRDVLRFAQEKGVTDIYLAAVADYEEPDGFAALADLSEQAERDGVTLDWVCGDPNWARSDRHDAALAVVDWALRVNARLQRAGLREIRVLQFDIEPYLLPGWTSTPGQVQAQYIALLAKLRDATRKAGFEYWLTVPFWFEQQSFQGRTLGSLAIQSSDGIVIMAYRNTATGVAEKAASLLIDAATQNRLAVVAIETGCREPPATTWCGTALDEIHGRLAPFGSLAGLAVHSYDDWSTAPSR
jgi:hypothetical protein